jgi:hypothetical protein
MLTPNPFRNHVRNIFLSNLLLFRRFFPSVFPMKSMHSSLLADLMLLHVNTLMISNEYRLWSLYHFVIYSFTAHFSSNRHWRNWACWKQGSDKGPPAQTQRHKMAVDTSTDVLPLAVALCCVFDLYSGNGAAIDLRWNIPEGIHRLLMLVARGSCEGCVLGRFERHIRYGTAIWNVQA